MVASLAQASGSRCLLDWAMGRHKARVHAGLWRRGSWASDQKRARAEGARDLSLLYGGSESLDQLSTTHTFERALPRGMTMAQFRSSQSFRADRRESYACATGRGFSSDKGCNHEHASQARVQGPGEDQKRSRGRSPQTRIHDRKRAAPAAASARFLHACSI